MKVEFDAAKNEKNIKERGLSFDLVRMLDFDAALVDVDSRAEYGETRYVALAPLDDRLYAVCFALRGDTVRVISFRKANKREEKKYGNR